MALNWCNQGEEHTKYRYNQSHLDLPLLDLNSKGDSNWEVFSNTAAIESNQELANKDKFVFFFCFFFFLNKDKLQKTNHSV